MPLEVSWDLIFVSFNINHNGINLFPRKSQEESDLPHEEAILRHPYQIKCWLRYLEHKSTAPKAVINLIYERALKELPGR